MGNFEPVIVSLTLAATLGAVVCRWKASAQVNSSTEKEIAEQNRDNYIKSFNDGSIAVSKIEKCSIIFRNLLEAIL